MIVIEHPPLLVKSSEQHPIDISRLRILLLSLLQEEISTLNSFDLLGGVPSVAHSCGLRCTYGHLLPRHAICLGLVGLDFTPTHAISSIDLDHQSLFRWLL